MSRIGRERVKEAAKIYLYNADAARSLGISGTTFARLCDRLGVESPYAQRRRRREEFRAMLAADACLDPAVTTCQPSAVRNSGS